MSTHVFEQSMRYKVLADLAAVTTTTKFPHYHYQVRQSFDLKHPIENRHCSGTTGTNHNAYPGCESDGIQTTMKGQAL